jgi:type IV pilus secretin PilQ/predicted competence protein
MNRYLARLALPVFGLLLVLGGMSQPSRPRVTVNKISILPARTGGMIVLESDAPLQNIKAAYAKEFPSILVVELGPVQMPPAPSVPADETQLVKDMKIQTATDLRASLFLTLREAVPFRVYADAKKTVIDLVRINRTGDDLVAPETLQDLSRTSRKTFALGGIEIEDKSGRLAVVSRAGQKTITNIFALDNPLRLVVDIYDAVYGRPTQTIPIGKFGVVKIKVGQFQTPPPYTVTRLVFELEEPRLFTFENGPNALTISFPGDSAAPAAAPKTVEPNGAESTLKAGVKAVETAPTKPADQKTAGAVKPAEAAAAPAKGVGENPPANPPAAAQTDAPQKEEKRHIKTIQNGEEKYSGELLSPRFKDADLRDVVLWLAEQAGLNVIFDPEVHGSVTCSFEAVPWDQFLDIILKNNKQGKTLEGNVLRIAPVVILADEEKAQQTLRDAKEQSGLMQTRMFTLSYAKAKDLVELLKNKKSTRGEIVSDERTNTLIVSDVKEKIDIIENLIVTLDAATPQVQIETRIVEASSTFVQNLGIQWGFKGIADPFYGNQTSLQFPNKVLVDGAMIPQGNITKGISGPLGGYAVNLPASSFNSVIGVSFANILDTFRLDLALSALETSGDGRIVSTQRISAVNNKEAYINQGRQIPVQTSANFTVTTQYVNAGLELRATPQITADGTIILLIDIQNNAADFANLVNGIPPITTQSAKTTVTVPDGGTTVIGGIMRVEDAITRERVPFLYSIPILGNLFKSFSKTRQNRELLIFITPRIAK